MIDFTRQTDHTKEMDFKMDMKRVSLAQRILVCGDRRWIGRALMERVFVHIDKQAVIIEGECQGADIMARELAKSRGNRVEPYFAEWRRLGRAAGPLRNQQMIDEGAPDLIIAFHAQLSRSRGTADMIRRAEKAGVPTLVFPRTTA